VFCYQQAKQDFIHHCFDSINRYYWSSIRLGTTEPLIVYLLLFPLFGVVLYFFIILVKEFKENQQYFETKLNTEEQLALKKIQEKRQEEKEALMETSNVDQSDNEKQISPIIAFQNGPSSRSPSRSRSASKEKLKSISRKSSKSSDKSSKKSSKKSISKKSISKKSISKKDYEPIPIDSEKKVKKTSIPINNK
jgi:multidrug efflux pump subunit AcrB